MKVLARRVSAYKTEEQVWLLTIAKPVSEVGWAGKSNGELRALAEQAGFEAFLTIDRRGIEYQQNRSSRNLVIILVRGKSNRLVHLLPLVPDILAALHSAQAGQVDASRPVHRRGLTTTYRLLLTLLYHTLHTLPCAATIGCPALHENAVANSGIFTTTPLIR
jgi:hypothetical protein